MSTKEFLWTCLNVSVHSRSNWNLKVLVFEERRKLEYQEKNLSEQRREPATNSTHIWLQHRDFNPSALTTAPPFLRPCSPEPLIPKWCNIKSIPCFPTNCRPLFQRAKNLTLFQSIKFKINTQFQTTTAKNQSHWGCKYLCTVSWTGKYPQPSPPSPPPPLPPPSPNVERNIQMESTFLLVRQTWKKSWECSGVAQSI